MLWAIVWLVWAHTTWVMDWVAPDHPACRFMLVVLMLISLAMSAAVPRAFTGTGLLSAGLVIGGGFALQQVGRTTSAVVVLRRSSRERLGRNFERILVWNLPTGAFAVGTDLAGGLLGFPAP
jgi:low temperature requirement protein LtrA